MGALVVSLEVVDAGFLASVERASRRCLEALGCHGGPDFECVECDGWAEWYG